MTFELEYQTESEETEPSHSCMDVTTYRRRFLFRTIPKSSQRKSFKRSAISGTTPANTKKSTVWTNCVFNC